MDKSNIEEKKKVGGQPGNLNAEKWTEEKALQLANDLIDWLNEKDKEGNDKGNIFYEEFLCVENDLYEDVIGYLCRKFTSFSELIKRAKKIQELRLMKFGIADRLQPTMTIFCLKNLHGWKDKQEVEHSGGSINVTFEKKSKEGIDYLTGQDGADKQADGNTSST